VSPPDLFSPAFALDPTPFYKQMRDEHPLFFHEGLKSWVLSRYEDVERAFKDPVFSTRNYDWQYVQWFGPLINRMEGAEHAAYRGALAPALRGRHLFDTFLPMIEEKARALFASFLPLGEVDLVRDLTLRFPINVIVGMLGLPASEHPRFNLWHAKIAAFFGNFAQDPDIHSEGLKTRDELYEYLLPVIHERREHPGVDLLSALCAADIVGKRPSDYDIQAFSSMLFGAGGDTVDRALANLWKALFDRPEVLAELRGDRRLLQRAMAEALRFSPPIHLLLRTTDAEVEVSGGVIPKDALVAACIGAANRDPRRFSDPDRFDIHRTDLDLERAFAPSANHVAFGGGRHFCLGSVLAKVEMETATTLLLDTMTDIRYADGRSPPEVGLLFRSPRTLPVRFTPQFSIPVLR
jgi:cytochrome P450